VVVGPRHRGRITPVHCKDVRRAVMEQARRDDLSFLDGVIAGMFTVPGDGMVDFPAVLAELCGYARWLVVEAEQDLSTRQKNVPLFRDVGMSPSGLR
jgi:inosose dehydratase